MSLAVKSGRSITWTNTFPALPQSVSTIAITGPQPISATLQAINGAPSLSENRFNPVMLVRAVNHLHALGKAKAIASLREFLTMGCSDINAERDPANIDTSDMQCVLLIVRILFDADKPGENLPAMNSHIVDPSEEDQALWPRFPLTLQDDIPFLLDYGHYAGNPPVPKPGEFLDWAEKYGKLRNRPLRPTDDLFGAVDKLMALPQTARLGAERLGENGVLRRQASRMLQHLTRRPPGMFDFMRHKGYDADSAWSDLRKVATRLKIRWDAERQEYVAGQMAK